MGWQLGLLGAASDLEITHQEVAGLMEGMVSSAVQAMVIVGIVSMFVRSFYGILGKKKLAEQEGEVLEIVERVW